MLVSENAKICVSPTQNIKFAFPPMQNPNASQWNIGCDGSQALGLCAGHVHFIFFVLISFALGSRRKRSFQWNMGLKLTPHSPSLQLQPTRKSVSRLRWTPSAGIRWLEYST